jgi:flavin-dependent dehydrogenase
VAAALLQQQGLKVGVYERETFPRFSIGESLLPQALGVLEQAGLLKPVVEAGFQFKDGAAFQRGEEREAFDFRDKSSLGWGTAYQVQRAAFDKALIDAVEARGVPVHYCHTVQSGEFSGQGSRLKVSGPQGEIEVRARFVLDATGFGRLLPRLLGLETPSQFPVRSALFTHIEDNIRQPGLDRNKILVTVHPKDRGIWYWLIPFSNGRCSLGVVAEPALIAHAQGGEMQRLQAMVAEAPSLAGLLSRAAWDTPARSLTGYSANVRSLHGPGWALLGNAGEFLDPVFSSGVTIAMVSARLAAPLVQAQLAGQQPDWELHYGQALRRGVDSFRAFVDSWYRGGLQDIIFHPAKSAEVKRQVCSVLAGYAWDLSNPYVERPQRLRSLELLCARAVQE